MKKDIDNKPPYAEQFSNGHWLWTPFEEEWLRNNYHTTEDLPACSEFLGRTQIAVQARASLIGIYIRGHWTNSEIALLRKHYATMPIDELSDMLGKTVNQIYVKARKLKIRKTKTDLNY